MEVTYKAFIILLALSVSVICDDKNEEMEKESEHIHTIHHYHVQKYDVIKKIEVPVIKEVKVPYYVYIPIKQPYKYYVNPLTVKVPIEYYHTKSEEHEKAKEEPHHEDSEEKIEHEHKEENSEQDHEDNHEDFQDYDGHKMDHHLDHHLDHNDYTKQGHLDHHHEFDTDHHNDFDFQGHHSDHHVDIHEDHHYEHEDKMDHH